MYEHFIRASFSFLAAAITLAMGQEWFYWALERREWWRVIPAAILGAFSFYEAHKVFRHIEALLRLP